MDVDGPIDAVAEVGADTVAVAALVGDGDSSVVETPVVMDGVEATAGWLSWVGRSRFATTHLQPTANAKYCQA